MEVNIMSFDDDQLISYLDKKLVRVITALETSSEIETMKNDILGIFNNRKNGVVPDVCVYETENNITCVFRYLEEKIENKEKDVSKTKELIVAETILKHFVKYFESYKIEILKRKQSKIEHDKLFKRRNN